MYQYKNLQIELLKSLFKDKKLTDLINKIDSIFDKYNKDYKKYTSNYKVTMEDAFNSLKIEHLIHISHGGKLSENFPEDIDKLIKVVQDYYNKIYDLRYLEFLSEEKKSIVLVGPNGSGKTTLLRKLINTTGEEKIGYYSADRLMIIDESYNPERNYDAFIKSYNNTDNWASDVDNNSQSFYVSKQLDQAISLFEKKHAQELDDCINNELDIGSTTTQMILNIWNSLIKDRILFSKGTLAVKTLEGQEYPIKYLSSGEKSIFYFLTCIFLKERKEYYFIDEPENNLNPSIVSKLWNIIEEYCKESVFIYLTHDSEFVASRLNSKVFWIEKYDGKEWKYNLLPENDNLPTNLMINLVGSRIPILFCESHDEYKYDDIIFKMMFEDFRVVPSGGCDSVISKVKAYSSIDLPQKAIGIIDYDYKTEDYLSSYEEKNIYILPFLEIENFLMCEDIVKGVINEYSKNPETAFDNLKQELKEKLILKKEQWIIRKIGFYLKNSSFNKKINMLKNYQELKSEYMTFQEEINLDELYKKFEKEIDDIIALDDYNKFLQCYDSKGMFKEDFKLSLNLKDDFSYEDVVFKYLKENIELLGKLRKKYFPKISV